MTATIASAATTNTATTHAVAPGTATTRVSATAVTRRRAVEALRGGVPSRDAVAALGTGQFDIEDWFTALCEAAAAVATAMVERPDGAANTDGQSGSAVADAAARLNFDERGYAELLRWTTSSSAGLNERFAATLALYAHVRARDAAFANTIVRFWSGDPIGVPELRRRLKEIGDVRPTLSPVKARELARQRLRFVAKLLSTAGSAGWVILFDEVELIGRYSMRQRARSYAEIARWVRGDHGAAGLPIAAGLAMIDDFEAAVITGRNDREMVPTKLREKGTPEAAALAAAAQQGMRVIDREMMLLTPPSDAELDQAYAKLKALHAEVFGWVPPDVPGLERLGATRMRQHVGAWINEWDLLRIDPDYQPDTEASTVASDYREDPDLEQSDSDDPDVSLLP